MNKKNSLQACHGQVSIINMFIFWYTIFTNWNFNPNFGNILVSWSHLRLFIIFIRRCYRGFCSTSHVLLQDIVFLHLVSPWQFELQPPTGVKLKERVTAPPKGQRCTGSWTSAAAPTDAPPLEAFVCDFIGFVVALWIKKHWAWEVVHFINFILWQK